MRKFLSSVRYFMRTTLLFNSDTEEGVTASMWRAYLAVAMALMILVMFGSYTSDRTLVVPMLWCTLPNLAVFVALFVRIRPMLQIGATRQTMPDDEIERLM